MSLLARLRWFVARFRPRQAVRLRLVVGPIEFKREVEDMALVLTDEQKVSISLQPVTAAGNPAKVDGAPTWSSSDPSILALDVAPDGLSAVATTVGPVGTSQIHVNADADLGAGVVPLDALLDVEVIAAQAASLTLVAGTPELK